MPTNILKSVEEAAAKEIIKYRHKMMQQVNSGLDKLKDIEFPDMKKKFEQAEEEFNKSMEDRLNQELSNGAQHFTEVKNDISSLGTDLGLLKESVAKFSKRIVYIAPSIVSTGPLGPSIAPQQMPALKEEITQEMEEMQALSTRCKNKLSKLQIDKISGVLGIDLRGSSPISSILSISDSVTSEAAGAMSEASNSMSQMESPDIGQKAEDCENYSPISSNQSPSASNCSNYDATDDSKSRQCTNCTKFKSADVHLDAKRFIYMNSSGIIANVEGDVEVSSNGIILKSTGITRLENDILEVDSSSSIKMNMEPEIG